MTSTELKIGLTNSARPSSRVLKPPGGGHSNIFAEPEVAVNAPRPKYNQQNSSNLNACMGSTDPNKVVEKMREERQSPKQAETNSNLNQKEIISTTTTTTKPSNDNKTEAAANKANANTNNTAAQRGRIPPGGFSSGGFW